MKYLNNNQPTWNKHHMTLPAAAMCSLVLIGWKPTNGTCIDNTKPVIKKTLYAEKRGKSYQCIML